MRNDGIYCHYCEKHSTISGHDVFVQKPFTGTRLTRHENSKQHGVSESAHREQLECTNTQQQIQDSLASEGQLTIDGEAFTDALRCLYFLAKNEMSHTTNYMPLRNFSIAMGNTTLPHLNERRNQTYSSEQSISEMLYAISDAMEELLENIGSSPFYSIIIDEATDLSVDRHIGLVIQYLNMKSAAQDVKFVKLLDVSKSPHITSNDIVTVLVDYLVDNALPAPGLAKLAGLTCDGASVMVQLKAKVPGLIVTHCSAHRLSLDACDAARATPWFERFLKNYCHHCTLFSRSTVRTAKLKEMQQVMNDPKLNKLKRPRWLSLENSVNTLR